MEARIGASWRIRRVLSLISVLAVLCAGCPLDPGSGIEPASGNGPANAAGAGSSGISGATQGTQTLGDQLAQQFPSCDVAARAGEWRVEVLSLVNVERARAGLNPVTHDQMLEDQATQYACELIHYDFFAHQNPVTGTHLADRADEFGYEYHMIGENLAAGQSSPAQVMADWMASEGHRRNILEPEFTELGVGVRSGGSYGTYWVQEFGRPAGD